MLRPKIIAILAAATTAVAGAITGAVLLVSSPGAEVALPLENCLSMTGVDQAKDCALSSFKALTVEQGPRLALDRLRSEMNSYTWMRPYCHDLSHAIGRASGQYYGDASEAYSAGYDLCDTGYYHGVIEGVALTLTTEEFMGIAPTICDPLIKIAGQNSSIACTHGIGHAMLQEGIIDPESLSSVCERMPAGYAQTECISGVSMQWTGTIFGQKPFSKISPAETTNRLDKTAEFCRGFSDGAGDGCWQYLTWATPRTEVAMTEASTYCEPLDPGKKYACALSLGREAAEMWVENEDSAAVARICTLLPEPGNVEGCVFSATKLVAVADYSAERAELFCEDVSSQKLHTQFDGICGRIMDRALQFLRTTG